MSIGTEFRKRSADTYPSQRLSKAGLPAFLRKLAKRWLAKPRKPVSDLFETSR
jgi:hypothetical protein